MPSTGDLKALLERVKASEGEDHDLDVAIAEWLYRTGAGDGLVNYEPELWVIRRGGWTGSIDECLALVKAVLPDWTYRITEIAGVEKIAAVLKNGWGDDPERRLCAGDQHECAPHAILAAMFAALIALEARHAP